MSIARTIVHSVGSALAPAMSKVFLKRPGLFNAFQAQGVHVVPNHFYSPVPDTRRIPDRLFAQPSEMPGIDLDLPGQRALMNDFRARFGAEFDAFRADPLSPADPPGAFSLDNGMYGPIDAEVLYGMVRANKPRRIVEIGSGYSTRLSAMAILANQREDPAYTCDLTCIEPYPSDALRAGFPGLSRLIVEPVEQIPLSTFAGLGQNDILFIDSSHVLKIGSDVQYEFLELLPRVGVGAIVHVHDIFFPFDYPRQWVYGAQRFWTEQYLLQTFLMFNDRFKTLWCGTAALHAYPDDVARCFPSYPRELARPGGRWAKGQVCVTPASFWMRRVRA